MAIQLGTVAAIGFEEFPPAQWLACFRQLGCEVVQAYRNQNASVSIRQMQEAISAGQMPCDSLHGIFGEQFDPSCPDERGRLFAVDTFKREGELAMELGGALVVVHCSTIRRNGVSPAERAARVDQLKKSIVEMGEFGEQIGVQYAFENLPGYHPIGADVAELVGLLDELAAPHTSMCFDTGHANMVGDAAGMIRQAGRQISYVHFSDNSSRGDDHEMPTYGTLNTDAVAAALHEVQYHGTMMLEVFHSIEHLKKLIDEGCADRLARVLSAANGSAGT